MPARAGQTGEVVFKVEGANVITGLKLRARFFRQTAADLNRIEISTVNGIKDVFGDYAQAGADAGLVKSANAQVLTKGTTSLALAGTGEGVNLGISAGKFTISPR